MNLTTKELKKLVPIMDGLESDALTPFKHFSGGFATVEMYDYDERFIDIEVSYGVQNDVESRVYTEQLSVDRKTMQLVN